MRFFNLLLLCLFCCSWGVFGQTTVGLAGYYPLDNSVEDATGNTSNGGLPAGDLRFACGVVGDALVLDGSTNEVLFGDPFNRELNDEDFTLSLYFKARGGNNTQYILSKRWSDCRSENILSLRYEPFSNSLNLFFGETTNEFISFVSELNPDNCWHHVVVWRRGLEVRLYIDGEIVDSRRTPSRIDLSNPEPLILGGSLCFSSGESRFSGLIDELRIYNRALLDSELDALMFTIDEILTNDTLIFQGESVDIRISKTCGESFFWTPSIGVNSFFEASPTITPTAIGPTVYRLSIEDEFDCIGTDSIRINVIDPADLDCSQIFLPNAFTPNNDNLNDNYGISNPFAIQQLISFEIYDRWGERVFFTTNPFEQWNGSFRGQELNPGVFLYKVRYFCRNEETVITGSITMMR